MNTFKCNRNVYYETMKIENGDEDADNVNISHVHEWGPKALIFFKYLKQFIDSMLS